MKALPIVATLTVKTIVVAKIIITTHKTTTTTTTKMKILSSPRVVVEGAFYFGYKTCYCRLIRLPGSLCLLFVVKVNFEPLVSNLSSVSCCFSPL